MEIKILNLIVSLSLVFLISCSSDDENMVINNNSFDVTVLRQGDKCGINDNDSDTLDYLIQFNENSSNLFDENNTIYYAANLPEEYKINDLIINITFRQVNVNDEIICNTSVGGDEYPFIYILSVN